MKRKVTRKAVESAIQQIKERGDKPTIERIRAITGGSPKTIGNVKKAIDNETIDESSLSLFDNVPVTQLSLHGIEKQIVTQIMERVDNIVKCRLDSVLSRLEGSPQNEVTPLPNTLPENGAPIEALSDMRELWLDACGQLSSVKEDFSQLEKKFRKTQQELSVANSHLAELEKEGEEHSHTDKGERIYKSELALAVRYLVMTVGMSQKDVGKLLGLNTNEVSQLKNRGTKLRQKRAKS